MSDPVSLGTPPFSVEEITSHLEEFAQLYQQRPIQDNSGGMEAPQMFPAWLMAKKLQPKYIIESGVWYGQGTWFFEKACPDSSIICIDPYLDNIRYTSPNAQYTKVDFSNINWNSTEVIPSKTLCFFDDHQNAVSRLPVAKKYKFTDLMFEDNYPRGRGDCVSLKTVLEEGKEESSLVKDYLDTYYEFPPVVRGENTRWGDPWCNESYPTYDALLTESNEDFKDYFEGYQNYTWICYARMKNEPV